MPLFTSQALAGVLAAELPTPFGGKFCVAFSGGLDSAVLLHALAELRDSDPDGAISNWPVSKLEIRAVYIDHQLQPASSQWGEHCARIAASLNLELIVEKVTIDDKDEDGLEAGARKSRYSALRRLILADEVLLTAHHADDQAETLLLALMRGSGVAGLAGMPSRKEFGRGWHLRPLLTFSRSDLERWAQERTISAVHDPTNALLRHDRNYLRHEVLPRLRARWPSSVASMGRSARHLGEALGLANELARSDLHAVAKERCLSISALHALPVPRCRNVLRYWLHERGLAAPSTRKLAGLMQDLFSAAGDRLPCVRWRGAELHWYRDLLYADADRELDESLEAYQRPWTWSETQDLPVSLGRLSMRPTAEQGFSMATLPAELIVRFRRGGEKIQLPGRQHRSALRNLLQESDVLPWWRDKLPLVYHGKRLLAVGDLFHADDFASRPGEAAVRVVWQDAPPWRAVRNERTSAS